MRKMRRSGDICIPIAVPVKCTETVLSSDWSLLDFGSNITDVGMLMSPDPSRYICEGMACKTTYNNMYIPPSPPSSHPPFQYLTKRKLESLTVTVCLTHFEEVMGIFTLCMYLVVS